MINPVAYISKEIQKYVLHVELNGTDFNKIQSIIRFHKKSNSDVSFSANSVVWENYFGKKESLSKSFPKTEQELKNFIASLLSVAKNWRFPVERIEHIRDCERLTLIFQRTTTVSELLRLVLNKKHKNRMETYGHVPKNPLKRIHNLVIRNDERILTYYRAHLIRRTLQNVLSYSEWIVVDVSQKDDDGVLQVEVLSVAAANREQEICPSIGNKVSVYCGIVVDPKTGKLVTADTAEYINLRKNDLNLMALHKYGIRAKDDQMYRELMDCLGVAAVTVDLLEKKCSSPATIIRNGQGSNTKGACFILYNSARLETLLKTFDARVRAGEYEPLPPIEEIDLGLLNNEEEWQLIFGYIFTFPDLIERTLRTLENGQFSSHLIVQYLSGLVGTFSVYYRRIRILTEYRAQLMATLYARIYLLKALQDVLNKALGLLNIEPVSHM